MLLIASFGLYDQGSLGNVDLNTLPLVVMMAVIIVIIVVAGGVALRNSSGTNKRLTDLFSDTLETILSDSREEKAKLLTSNQACIKGQQEFKDALDKIVTQQIAHDSIMIAQNDRLGIGLGENRRDHDDIKGQVAEMSTFMSGVQQEMRELKNEVTSIKDDVSDLKESKTQSNEAVAQVDAKLDLILEAIKDMAKRLPPTESDVQ